MFWVLAQRQGCVRIQTLILHTYFLESSNLYK